MHTIFCALLGTYCNFTPLQAYLHKSTNEIIQTINDGVGLYSQAQLYGLLLKKEGIEKEVNGHTSKIIKLLSGLVNETVIGAISLQVMVTKTQGWSLMS